jgi:hypothetical protein
VVSAISFRFGCFGRSVSAVSVVSMFSAFLFRKRVWGGGGGGGGGGVDIKWNEIKPVLRKKLYLLVYQ